MKIALILPIALFAYNITNTKTFSIKLTPDLLKTTLQISILDKNLNKLLKKTNLVIKASSKCKQITYNFSPYYEYKNKKRVFLGYKANIKEVCEFKNPKDFSTLLSNLPKEAKVSLNSIKYISSKQKEAIKKLKLNAYNFSINEANKLSKALNKTCILKNISFNTTTPIRYKKVKALSVDALNAPLPKGENEVKLTANYLIECF